jgi:hypothetical protein
VTMTPDENVVFMNPLRIAFLKWFYPRVLRQV